MSISKSLAVKIKDCHYTCIDIYPNRNNWVNYQQFDGNTIPFGDKTYDIAIFSDVLHHDFSNIESLLTEARRVAKYIIIKDHFEYGFFSRKVLQIADFIGNYGYGVSIPNRYLSQDYYKDLIDKLGLLELNRTWPINLYPNSLIAGVIIKKEFQFISILSTENHT
ncbi:hypothetical protein VSU01S_32740 [Vibrio superstes NBRC 103154]|uniref:Methyltransferase type 11 domain-containing protein n=2 Tax=Vibrio superstes TaxID=198815 RepID=A0A511QUJ2_9VIBR|nr:hypothetical protein VSU01S_32740 [Vibrio superstes NBRC 103154]